MKKIHEMVVIASLMLLSFTSCKDKPANDSIDTVPA
ncbi:hypothetical protein FLLO111716_11125 [Flavobacterium longum]